MGEGSQHIGGPLTPTYVPQPTAPSASDATRLLCAGAYVDVGFREAVIDELYVHEERIAAPSLGIDATRVLAHALRARRVEFGWALVILLMWIAALPLTRGLALFYLPSFAMLVLAGWVRGAARRPSLFRRVVAWQLRWGGRALLVFVILLLLGIAAGGSGGLLGIEGAEPALAWFALALPLLMAWVVAAQGGQFAKALTGELSRARFPDLTADPAEQAEGERFHRLRRRIHVEQRARLVMYRAAAPFCGAGTPYAPWSLSVELRPREGAQPEPVDNTVILGHIVPLLEALRVPSPHGAPYRALAVRDRLRELEIDEVVFLPADGLPRRSQAPYAPEAFEEHRFRSVEEGGETRRHFLRVRVGGWDEEVVTTVFVRAHTQGGMLMLEVAPHVLRPVRQLYQYADRAAYRYRHNSHFGKAVWALGRVPASAVSALVTMWRASGVLWRIASGGHGKALADGPWASVRELGSDDEASLFQEMDVSRYLKSIQDRVAVGVRRALSEAGWQTEEFEQKIDLAIGTLSIGTVGALAIGNQNTVVSNTGGATATTAAHRSGGDHGST
ncbi:hypothetical protein M4V62_17745 [Streptomyces durmitorensis]|uniref:Uncharacterized protein n=1 Tax=Streptomyces durmitorensis TaxID=319947 RepID=A0ABY4PU81_9ACTN|nr:hypothetical protein [Streptomyces durmitorensis]UQT56789.1 hypothetical protein M4V62_17745 [Streptomyces durmitorensis]